MKKSSESVILKQSLSEVRAEQWHQILTLRSEVFVVEQDCIYPDPDDQDRSSWHLSRWQGDQLLGYARVMMDDQEAKIGRIVTHPNHRSSGVGSQLVEAAIAHCIEHNASTISMSAQAHLCRFYGKFQFYPEGSMYLEDGIPHIRMVYKP